MRHSCWPPFQRRALSLKVAYSKQKDRSCWQGWRQRPARKMWIDLGDVGDRTKKDRPEAVSSKRSHPVLAGLITLAVPARRAGPTLTVLVVESGDLVSGGKTLPKAGKLFPGQQSLKVERMSARRLGSMGIARRPWRSKRPQCPPH